MLQTIGVRSRADLVEIGALETYQRLLAQGYSHNQNVVLLLHGAITNKTIDTIPNKEIAYLLEETAALQPETTKK